MSDTRLVVSSGLEDFFRTEVTQARSNLGIDLSDFTEFYLVNMLCGFSQTGPILDEPLVLQYKRALESQTNQRFKILKELGDATLYIAGFFVEFIERSLVDIDYYVAMGGTAYNNVSKIAGNQPGGEVFVDLYSQLAHRFAELVDLLNEVSEKCRNKMRADRDLLRLYDRWLRTKSARIRKLLAEEGLIPIETPTQYVQ